MKYLVVSDIHGNYPALKAIYDKELSNVDGVIFVGDIIGLMGFPSETVDLIMREATHAVKGNHDISVLERKKGHVNSPELSEFELDINWDNLSEEQIEWVTNSGPMKKVPDEGLLIAHAQPIPSMASGIEKGNAGVRKGKFTQVAANIDSDTYNFVLLGHTHQQAKVDCARFGHEVIILNPGSAGQNLGEPADYAIIDTEEKSAKLCSVEYDYNEVVNKLKDEKVPIKWWI